MLPDNIRKNCGSCLYKKKLFLTGDLLCQYKGIVQKDQLCRRFSYDIFTNPHKKKRPAAGGRYTQEDFKL